MKLNLAKLIVLIALFFLCSFGLSCSNEVDSVEYTWEFEPFGKMISIGEKKGLPDSSLLVQVAFEQDTLYARVTPKVEDNFICYYPSGEVFFRANWDLNKGFQGKMKFYEKNKTLRKVINYIDGEQTGASLFWSSDGALLRYEYKKSNLQLIEYLGVHDSLSINIETCPMMAYFYHLKNTQDTILLKIHAANPPGLYSELVLYPKSQIDSIIFLESPDNRDNFSLLLPKNQTDSNDMIVKYYLMENIFPPRVIYDCEVRIPNPNALFNNNH